MDNIPATDNSEMVKQRPTKRQRSHTIAGPRRPDHIRYQRQVSAMDKSSPNVDPQMKQKCSKPATIHRVQRTRTSFFDDNFTFSPPAAPGIHALRPRTRSCLDKLPTSELGQLRSLSHQVSTATTAISSTPLASERTIRMQMLDQYLSKRSADLVTTAVPSTRLFHPSFHHHLINELKKISHNSDKHWLYWYLYILFKYTGLKHITLSLILILYTLAGGAVFKWLEHTNERETTLERATNILAEITAFASAINQTANVSQLTAQLTDLYSTLRDIDGGLVSSLDRMDPGNATWTFETGTFYAMTILSTIGYGTIACKTAWGKAITVVYVTVGLPLALIVLRDIGLILFVALQKAYNYFHEKRKAVTKKINKEDTVMTIPLWLGALLVYVYLLIMTLIVFFLDFEIGDLDGLSFGDSFYFAFISLTTIGLGDVMPNNIHDDFFFGGVLLSGLALLSIVNTATYARIERKYFNAMSALEHLLLELEDEKEKRMKMDENDKTERMHGKQPICHELVGIVHLAALIIPSLDNRLDDAVVKANEATDREDDATPLPTFTEPGTNYVFRNRSGWASMRSSMRAKYESVKTLVGGAGSSSTVPSHAADTPPRPPISFVRVDFASEMGKHLDKRFIVCPVSGEP